MQFALLPLMKLLLPQLLIEPQVLDGLPLPRVGRRILAVALVLLHSELQLVLLLLPQELVLLQRPQRSILGAPRRNCQRQYQNSRRLQ